MNKINDTFEQTFKNQTITEFNEKYRTSLVEGMDTQDVVDNLDHLVIKYVYISLREEDVLSAYRNFYRRTGHECDLVCIEGLYLALY